jgi:hypothetical protein
MHKRSIAAEVAALLAVHPTEAELDEAVAACDAVIAGIAREPGGWKVDPALVRLTARRSPAHILRAVHRGREAALIVRATLHAA